MKVVSRGLPSRVFTFPLRDRYLPPCLCTSSCTEAAYAGIHPSSVTLMSAITYTVIVFISSSRSQKPRCARTSNWTQGFRNSFDHCVGAREQRWWDFEAERSRGLKIDHQLVLSRRLHRQVGGPRAFEDAIDVTRRASEWVDRVGAVRDQATAGDEAAIQ